MADGGKRGPRKKLYAIRGKHGVYDYVVARTPEEAVGLYYYWRRGAAPGRTACLVHEAPSGAELEYSTAQTVQEIKDATAFIAEKRRYTKAAKNGKEGNNGL